MNEPVIGFYGGTCNNLYVFAKALAEHGYPVVFIEDRRDNFPHSQPVWEDVDCYFKAGFNYGDINWGRFEEEYDWERPAWYFVPEGKGAASGELYARSTPGLDFVTRYLAARYLGKNRYSFSVFRKMLACDFLIVCGVEPSMLAMLSGRPYMIFPHGSDVRVAIGVQRKDSNWKGILVEQLATKSFSMAAFIGSSLPDASAEVPRSQYRRLKDLKVERVPLPYRYRGRIMADDRVAKLKAIFAELGWKLPAAGFYAFTPSRINFYWKGHDRLLNAIAKNREAVDVHFIFLGWGDDYLQAMEFVTENALERHITILPVFLSKAFLFRFFEGVDFIIDEFNGSGSYGTALSEAMSCGCPVLTWISEMFDAPGWERPPVIQARTENQIADAIVKISSRQIDLDAYSELTADWFKRVHGSESVIRALFDNISEHVVS